MTYHKKNPSGGNRNGANQIILSKPNRPMALPQGALEPLLRRAHLESIRRNDEHPTPENAIIAQTMGQFWKRVYIQECCQ